MLYYLGKGTELKKEECKEYKTIEGALKAAAKDEYLVVWDENGQVIGSLTNNAPEGAPEENSGGSANVYDADGNLTGTVDDGTVAAITGNDDGKKAAGEGAESVENGSNDDKTESEPSESENGQNESNTKSEDEENGEKESRNDDGQQGKQEIIIPQGTMRVTVVCDGALNIRRSAAWGNENICGRAVRGQSYYVKAIHTVDEKKMVQTIDNLYLSGQSEHVQFDQL